MKLTYYIAKRYLFSKKSHNAINIISMVSVCGVAIATIAMVCTLSVFNGFTDVVSVSFNAFDPDLEISITEGKVFNPNDDRLIDKLKTIEEIELIAETLEENALLKFEERQEPILLRGVTSEFRDLAAIDSLLLDGEYLLRDGDIDFGVMGAGLAVIMGTRAGFLSPLEIWMPKRNARVNAANPMASFNREDVYISSVFALNQANYDDQMFIVSIDLVRELLNYENEVSTLSLKLKTGTDIDKVKNKIRNLVGAEYQVKNRMEQQSNIYQWVNMEKWITFFILIMISTIAIFNVVGSLSMLILEKTEDIRNLQSMGAKNSFIANIFMLEGWLIVVFGSFVGLVIGVSLCLIQEYFGILKIGEAGVFMIDSYPIRAEFFDIIVIFLTVNFIGFLAALYPSSNLKRKLNKVQK